MTKKINLVLTVFFLVVLARSFTDVKLKEEGSKLCFTCHKDKKLEVADDKDVHFPVKIGNCTSCHSPHAGKYKYMLIKKGGELCFTCHEDVKAETHMPYVHTALKKGECTKCHDPHASNFPYQLKKPEDRICFSCHSALKNSIEKLKDAHPPAAAGECTTCHSPHASGYEYQLVQAQEKVCFTCHDKEQKSFKKAHLGYPVGQGGCTMCHDPHASDSPKLIKKYSHFPMREMMCSSCHAGPGNSDPLKLVKPAGDLCYGCHQDKIDNFDSKKVVHNPVKKRECIKCHSPHASDYKDFIIEPEKKLCFSCHKDMKKTINGEGMYVHTALSKVECTKCHNPHSSNTEDLLVSKDVVSLCTGCHPRAGKHSHPIGAEAVNPKTGKAMTCTSCHASHASRYEFFLKGDRKEGLCVQCHKL
ncbi:MAG: hypothetical protein GXP33_15700 [Spirochaetes bacterium]|nr:hypothetical protein [Spirochaetota bacterium]